MQVKRGDTALAYFMGRVEGDPTTPTHKIARLIHTGEHWVIKDIVASCTTMEAALAAGRLLEDTPTPGLRDLLEDTKTPLLKKPLYGFET